MKRTVSIVEARRELGRLAEEVRRTGRTVVLTRRGRPVAQIVPEPAAAATGSPVLNDPFASLRGTIKMHCSFDELQRAVRTLRGDFARNLERRALSSSRATRRRG